MRNRKLKTALLSSAALIAAATTLTSTGSIAGDSLAAELSPVVSLLDDVASTSSKKTAAVNPDTLTTKTPIKHIVVIFNENESFDHYFGTYPNATNVDGEPRFEPAKNTPTNINNLLTSPALLDNNPNLNPLNGTGATNPFRLDRTQANTADQSHSYSPEQKAYDNGKVDLFPLNTGSGTSGGAGAFGNKGQVMGYFDGNTVTALWNYAQNYAMSDNAYGDQFGPSTPGAINMFAGQTNGFTQVVGTGSSNFLANSDGSFTLIGDVDPARDTCSSTSATGASSAKNIGDLLNAAHISWGGFMGGFNIGVTNANGTTGCGRSTVSATVGETVGDYVPHHNWFQYFASTANPTHARPAVEQDVGYTFQHNGAVDPANHEYDLRDLLEAVKVGYLPAVSYVKLPAYQDGHAGYSDPLDEQAGLVQVINSIQRSPMWANTAIIVAWDDSDGWYDHAYAKPTNPSYSAADLLNGTATCGTGAERVGLSQQPVNGRCGPGTRIPFLVISPWAKQNYVDSTRISQASVVQFIEYNWLSGRRLGGGSFDISSGAINAMFNFSGHGNTPELLLNPTTGESLN